MSDLTQFLDRDDDERVLAAAESLVEMAETVGWKWLMLRFKAEAEAALDELREVDPTDTAAVMRLQNRANRYYEFENTVTELLREAASRTAHEELNEEGDATD